MLRWDSRRASTATVLKRKSKANTEKGNPGKSSLSIYGILLKMTKGTNVKSVWNQNERKQLILTDDHNTFSTTNWVDLTLNRWGQKRTHAKIHPDYIYIYMSILRTPGLNLLTFCPFTSPPYEKKHNKHIIK